MTTQPAQTNLDPMDRTSHRRSSIRTKITFWAGLWLVLVSLILIGYSVYVFRNTAIDNATNEALALSEVQAGYVLDVLNPSLMTARTLAESLEAVKDPSIPITLSRDEANAILRKILLENPSFLGTYTLWEPNEFDGLDSQYVRAVAHDETGRFIPYWVRDLNGIIHTEALTQYETPGVGDWYIVPRSTLKEITIAPIVRRIQGQDLTIASFIVPIVANGKFYGIAGVDAPIGIMQELVDKINLYDGSADVALFTESGTLIAVRNRPDIANKSIDLIYKDYDQIQPQLNNTFSRLSQDGKYLQIFSPIKVDNAGTHWVLGFSIPFDKITAPATNTAIRQIVISLAFIILALVFLWIVAGQIVRPMQALTNAAQTVSAGNLNVTANVHSNDETGVLADAFNSMTSQLKTLFATLEQRVMERTEALTSVAEVGTAVSTILETNILLQTVVDLAKEQFNFYHAHIYLMNEAGDALELASGAGEVGKQMAAKGFSILLNREQSLVARAAREKKGVTVNDVTQAPDFLPNPLLPNTRSELAVPMVVGEKVIGVFDVQSDVVGRFTEADINVQTALAAQVAVAVQNARQYDQTQSALAQTEKLFEGSRLITQADSLQEMIASIMNLINIPAINGALLLMHNRGGEGGIESMDVIANWWSGVGDPVYPVGMRFATADNPGLDAFVSPVNLFFKDIYEDERTKGKMQASGVHSMVVLPLLVGSKQIGALSLLGSQPYDFTPDEIQLFSTLAPQVATATENRLQFERVQVILESITLPLIITRLSDNHITFINKPAAEVVQLKYEDVINKPAPNFYYKSEDRVKFIDELKSKGSVADMTVQLKRGDGEPFWASLSARSLNYQGEASIITSLTDISERIHAQQAIAKHAAELATVAEVSQTTSTELDPDALLQTVVDTAKERFELYHAHIYLADNVQQTLRLTSGSGDIGRKMVAESHAIAITAEKSLVARAYREKEAVIVNDVKKQPDFLPNPLLPDTQAEIATPMIVGDEVLGVFDVQTRKADGFSKEDAAIYTTLASQVAVALQNARSFTRAQQQAARESTLNTISQKIQSATSVEAVLQIAARELGHALGAPMTVAQLSMKDKA